ncbi:MAG: HD domain-containing protein [Ruminococcaceae bacterium]|nr:HD domain-containing protein [Oscillospiraceae bacterium]
MVTFEAIKANPAIRTYIEKEDEALIALGYTEHSFPHVGKVANTAGKILRELGYPAREAELAEIAGYLHDIGNIVNRSEHAQSGAVMAFRILDNMGMEPAEIAAIIGAIGNHDESTAVAGNAITAALILADKTDVRESRVRNQDMTNLDIHDRVNYSVKKAELFIRAGEGEIELSLVIDTTICPVMEYFEIFLTRMKLCDQAAHTLGLHFRLRINDQLLL